MSEPLKKSYVIQEDVPKDIELMSIWAQAAEDYMSELTSVQLKAAITWFKAYVDSRIDTD
jgi:hypothetical protein